MTVLLANQTSLYQNLAEPENVKAHFYGSETNIKFYLHVPCPTPFVDKSRGDMSNLRLELPSTKVEAGPVALC